MDRSKLKGLIMKKFEHFQEYLGMALTLFFILALFGLIPLVAIWALNTLFPALAIPYTLYTWIAVVALIGIPYLIFHKNAQV
jgi:hypothetical protein